ncbi:MAG: hypothetical protein GXX96_21170 [Planctomycetaceae bacterium]|nr:hypothetical protein [Planctomycetaceae bacterium]
MHYWQERVAKTPSKSSKPYSAEAFLEADLPTFVKYLLRHEAQQFDPRLVLAEDRFKAVGHTPYKSAVQISDGQATALGRLAVLSEAKEWGWQNRAVFRAFCKWVERFNEHNS